MEVNIMANFDVNNFVIDRVVRGVALSQKDDSVLFSINQMQNVSLNCASESTDAVDALGTPIATFYRAKSAEFSAENALFDMNLMATQLGTKKAVADANNKITVPAMETFIVESTEYKLKHTPIAKKDKNGQDVYITEIYELNGDSTFGIKYSVATSAGEGTFAYVSATKTVTLPESAIGKEMFVMYEYETENAVEVINSAIDYPVGCKFVMEVLGCDVCDQTNLIYAYIVFPNFKLSPDFDWSIATDGAHPFSGKAQQEYCDRKNKLFNIIIPGDE